LFFWEQVNKTNPAFRITQVFVSRDIAEKLLPLYALFSIVEQISGHSSEEELVHSKLAWWKLECSPERLDQSRRQNPGLKPNPLLIYQIWRVVVKDGPGCSWIWRWL
jgi:phytoene/squalene synthetase